jgi:hypothetical protein
VPIGIRFRAQQDCAPTKRLGKNHRARDGHAAQLSFSVFPDEKNPRFPHRTLAYHRFGRGRTLAGATAHAATPTTKPNVVLILADDLGWTDIAPFGSDLHETPALDQLARDGMKFTQKLFRLHGLLADACRAHDGQVPRTAPHHRLDPRLDARQPEAARARLDEVFADRGDNARGGLQSRRYSTATIGKWHLAKVGTNEAYPESHGFDLNIAGTDKPQPPTYTAPWKIPTLSPEGRDGEHLTERLGEEAVKWLESVKDKPFFLYLPHFRGPHANSRPAGSHAKYEKKIAAKGADKLNHKNPGYAAMDGEHGHRDRPRPRSSPSSSSPNAPS